MIATFRIARLAFPHNLGLLLGAAPMLALAACGPSKQEPAPAPSAQPAVVDKAANRQAELDSFYGADSSDEGNAAEDPAPDDEEGADDWTDSGSDHGSAPAPAPAPAVGGDEGGPRDPGIPPVG